MRNTTFLWGAGLLAVPALLAGQRQTPAKLTNAAIVAARPVAAPACASAKGLARV